jgi:hypothetical protein
VVKGATPGVDAGQAGKRSAPPFFADIPFEFVEEDRSVREVGELSSYRKKPAKSSRISMVLTTGCVSMASPIRYPSTTPSMMIGS